jgi:glucose/arabinose dehydrogenase
MTGSAMPVTTKTRRIRDRLAARCSGASPAWARVIAKTLACGGVLALFAVSLGSVSQSALAADAQASSSAPGSSSAPSSAKSVAAQVEAALAAADRSSAGTPAAAAPVAAGAPSSAPSAADTRSLDEDTQQLKKDVVDLNRDLFVLEEELLFPANTQVAVYVSMDVGEFFALDSITLKIDNKEVTNYLYTPREVDALLKGGVQRLYLGNLKVGSHELVAFFAGKGPDNRDYRRGASLKFDKSIGAKYLELKIEDRQRKMQPEFEIKDWE